jgi:hypothetical protein
MQLRGINWEADNLPKKSPLYLTEKWTDFVAKSADIVAKSAGLGRFSCCQLMPVKHSLAA